MVDTAADIPGRLAIFLAGCVALYLVRAVLSPETRGGLDRDGEEPTPRTAPV